MTETAEKKKKRLSSWFLLCPVRHTLAFAGAVLICAYFLLRGKPALMESISLGFVRPARRFLAAVFNTLPFSVAEMLIVAFFLLLLVYIIVQVCLLIRRNGKLPRLYRTFITAVMLFSLVYGGFCLLWGVYYYTSDFEEQSGIKALPVSVEDLKSTTSYFAGLCNEYSAQVARDENGGFAESIDDIFDFSSRLYDNVEQDFPCLEGDGLRAKPFLFSKALSCINFTGFFFPFTGEANINTDSPLCFIPSTIAHELAHQRGVAEEDEANFVAVLASLESGNPVYIYSASLLAYVHLGNSLYAADKQAWSEVYSSLNETVLADFAENNAYWEKYETPVSTVSDAVYTGFLQGYGQELGLKSYGACVDLLVAYYCKTSFVG